MKIKLKDGRFVIPKIMRETLGIKTDSEIEINVVDKKIIITKPKNK